MTHNGQAGPVETRTRYGTTHPERVDNPLWEQAIRQNWSGYALRKHAGPAAAAGGVRLDYSVSHYRATMPGPYWSWQRFGRTSTALPDGRVLHIAGEHEDSYDPDFCIYNDVVVEHQDGRLEIYLYPLDVFPPTDFHSATLIGDDVLLIGALGYRDLRRPGETQVLRLDTRTLKISSIATHGERPGWLSRHIVERLDDATLLIVGGMLQSDDGYKPNGGIFTLDTGTMTWQRRPHADMSLFPVSATDYARDRNPRYGTANPEAVDNPFWIEMARRKWTPKRARLHYGDVAPPEPPLELPEEVARGSNEPMIARLQEIIGKTRLKRARTDVVWTAVREEPAFVELEDGRALTIGGRIADYGEEHADPWVYNDIIATDPDGAIRVMAYPRDVLPHLSWPVAVAVDKAVYIFGRLDRKSHPETPRMSTAVLRLDTRSFQITPIGVEAPTPPILMYPGAHVRDANRVIFPLGRRQDSDPELGIAFDLGTETWSAPFPHRPPPADED